MRDQFFSAMTKGWGFLNSNLMANLLSGGVAAFVAHELTRSHRENEIAALNQTNTALDKKVSSLTTELESVKHKSRETKIELTKHQTLLFECLGKKVSLAEETQQKLSNKK